MKNVNKLKFRKISIAFLMLSLIFTSLAPSLSLAAEAVETAPIALESDNQEMTLPIPKETELVKPIIDQPTIVDDVDLGEDEGQVDDLGDIDGQALPEELSLSAEEELFTLAEGLSPYLDLDEVKPLIEKVNIDDSSASGALIYNYPIDIPKGRNGMQPNLVLTYNNQNRDALNQFGFGWSINIPSIKRINKKGTDKLYTENYFSSSFSGELKLVSSIDGLHGEYAAEVETGDFLKYEFTEDDYWKVTDKQGQIYIFGYTSSSRQDNPNDASQIYQWMLDGNKDTNGNYVRYEYFKDSGQIYPDKIIYTGYDTMDGIFEVEFFRESRLDDLESYDSKFLVKNNYRISEIQIKINSDWVRKYDLMYIEKNEIDASYLDTIVESSKDINQVVNILPATKFDYQNRLNNWALAPNWQLPMNIVDTNYGDNGVRLIDVNGDSLIDIVKEFEGPHNENNGVYINNGTGWTLDTNWVAPFFIVFTYPDYIRVQPYFTDVNGDGLVDLVRYHFFNSYPPYHAESLVYINTGSSWVLDDNWELPLFLTSSTQGDLGVRFADVNGDGLVDFLKGYDTDLDVKEVYINNGAGWTLDSSWALPETFSAGAVGDFGTRLADVNGDGLIDIVKGWDDYSPNGDINKVYINNGSGWNLDPNWILPELIQSWYYNDLGVRLVDVNGDGLDDVARGRLDGNHILDAKIYINTGAGWVRDLSWILPEGFTGYSSEDLGTRLLDIDGDGLMDIVRGWSDWDQQQVVMNSYIKYGDIGFLSQINTSDGVKININYQSSALENDNLGNFSNPNLPYIIQAVEQITIDDVFSNQQTINYNYSGGEQYDDNLLDKKFAGFAKVEKVIGNTKTITYYHQGNISNSSQGEYQDSYHKIGKPYRQEIYDNNTNELLNQTIYKWEETDLGYDNKFVYNSQKSSTDFTQSIQSTAVQNEYDFSTGNLLVEHNLGQVQVDTATGEIFDQVIGDEKDTDYDYAQNTTKHILSAPKTKIISDTSDSKEQNLYYDNLPLGQIEKVNLTKEDYIEQDVEVNRNFNNYGLVSEEISPEGDSTAIVYDSFNLYPAEITNALGQTTHTEYNLLNGQLATSTASNGMLTVNSFDAFGRLVEVKITDPNNPATTVIKQEIEYQDPFASFQYSSDTGWLSPTQTGKYYNQFYNPSNAYVSDDIYTTARDFGGGGSSRFQSYEGFDINIPTAAEITGLEVMVEHLVDDITDVDESIRYYSASNGAWSDNRFLSVSTIDHVDTAGSSNDLWALNPITSDFIDSNFSVSYIGSRLGGGDTTWSLDDIKIKVYYRVNTKAGYKQTKDYFDTSSYTTSREYYDGLYRVIQKKTSTANTNEFATVDILYDAQGRVSQESLPYITSTIEYSAPDLSKPVKTYTYDALNRILTESNPTGSTSYEYNGWTTTITDSNGNKKDLIKDAYGNLVEVKEYNNNGANVYTTNYQYSLTNKLEKITDSQGNIRNFSYDALDNLVWQDMAHTPSVTTPAKIQYTHDKNGNVLTETSFKGDDISYEYDNLNRVLYEKLSGVNQISYIYDQNGDTGQLTFADYGTGNSQRYDYDILGRLTTATTTIESEDFALKYAYNLNGAVKEIIYPNGWKVNYDFDAVGQVNSVSLDKGQGPVPVASNILYNQNGQMIHLERANGIITDYTYDPSQAFRLTRILSVKDSVTLQDLNYTYDNVGNILSIADNSGTDLAKTVVYSYDDLNRLLSATASYANHPENNYSQTFTYDAIGNMTYNSELGTMNYVSGQPHQLTSYGTRAFTYDMSGNMKTNQVTKFAWDWRNRLKNSYDIATSKNSYYQYDHNNQRFLKYSTGWQILPPPPPQDGLKPIEDIGDIVPVDEPAGDAVSPDNDLFPQPIEEKSVDDTSELLSPVEAPTKLKDIEVKAAALDLDNQEQALNIEKKEVLPVEVEADAITDETTEADLEPVSNNSDMIQSLLSGDQLVVIAKDKYIDKYFEKDLAGNTKSHIFLNNIRIATLKNNDAPYYYSSDHLGSQSIITDSSGNILELSDYQPYGKINHEVGSFENEYKFTDKQLDNETGIQYFGARYMDNEIGRFISMEPVMMVLHDGNELKKISGQELQKILSDPQALNSYVYSKNNPVIFVDPDGNWWKEFFTGQQSWSSFQTELGQAAQQLYNDSGTARAAMDHPYVAGAVVGVAGGAAFAGASAGLTSLSTQYLGGAGTACIAFCSQMDKASRVLESGRGWSPGQVADSAKNLVGHFDKHAGEIGAKNISQYYQKANDFIQSGYTNVFKEGADKVYYNVNNNLSAIVDANNQIKTFYRVENINKISSYLDRINKLK